MQYDEVHIGKAIQEKLKEQGRSVTWLANKTPCTRCHLYYEKGAYIINVTQQSGYIIYPTEETYHVNVTSGGRSVCSFPQIGNDN